MIKLSKDVYINVTKETLIKKCYEKKKLLNYPVTVLNDTLIHIKVPVLSSCEKNTTKKYKIHELICKYIHEYKFSNDIMYKINLAEMHVITVIKLT